MIEMKEKNSKTVILKNGIGILCVLMTGIMFYLALTWMNWIPGGNDVWGHLYKSEYMYECLKQGILYPLYDEKWYNGIQIFRYWPPMSSYLVAGCLFITGGELIPAYRIFLGILIVVGGIPWVIWGNIEQRRVMGTLFGCIWYFLPVLLKNALVDGNMPQMTSAVIVPYVILFLHLYVHKHNDRAALGLLLSMMLMSVTHLMITAIMGVVTFLYLLVDQVYRKDWRRMFEALFCMVCGIMAAGIYVIPALLGEGMSFVTNTGKVNIDQQTSPFSISLNPFYRFVHHTRDTFYLGISILLVCILGLLLARGKKKAGFLFGLLLIALTTPATIGIISSLPLGNLLWITRASPALYGFVLAALMEWSSLKKKYCVLIVGLLCIDVIPSLMLWDFRFKETDATIEAVRILRENTEQRATVMDLSEYGSYPSYGISSRDGANYSYGWAWQGAATGENIMLLNEAMENGRYLYMFDRCLELGDDTILVQRKQVENSVGTPELLIQAAEKVGYSLLQETESGYIFKLNAPETFGMITTYQGMAIGEYAKAMTTVYPCFEGGASDYIDDYTFDELKDYETVFLSGFQYRDKKKAEDLVNQLGKSGVRIVIDTTHVPATAGRKELKFLDVLHQDIKFTNHYPILSVYGESVTTGAFLNEDSEFNTGYISYLDQPLGTFWYNGHELTFFGRNNTNENIYFVGMNLMYFATSTGDDAAVSVLDRILGLSSDRLPVRELVPLQVQYGHNTITIESKKDNVNSTVAFQDTFQSDSRIWSRNHLLCVNAGTTVITMRYPNLVLGIIISILGIVLYSLEYYFVHKKSRSGCS